MSRYRSNLPQIHDQLFLTDGGMETYLTFEQGIHLPDFASFHLLQMPGGDDTVRAYFRAYADIARRHGTGLVLDTATWRASADWGLRHGLDAAALAGINARAVSLLERLRDEFAPVPVVISGCIGPRGDGYVPGATMTVRHAEAYHQPQIDALAATNADMLCAMTLNYVEEAIGIAHAARRAGMPLAISFTVETNGKLPTGQSLGSAIRIVSIPGSTGCGASGASAPTRPVAATPSSTTAPISTPAIRSPSPPLTRSSGSDCRS
jgi:S-methylmethionine-dependent homocysteine/selenocysteine methylase